MAFVYRWVTFVFMTALIQIHAENKDASSVVKNMHDDKAYRAAVGKKYFASLEDGYDRDSWRDPYDMFDYETGSAKKDRTPHDGYSAENSNFESSESVGSEKEDIKNGCHCPDQATVSSVKFDFCSEGELKKCDKNEYIYITRWLRKFLRKMNYEPDVNLNDVQTVQFSVANSKLHEMSMFLDSKNWKDMQDLEGALDGIFTQFHIVHPDSRGIIDVIHFMWGNGPIILILLSCVVFLWYLCVLFRHQRILKLFIIVSCITSYVWTWIHLYQKEIAKQQATLHSTGYPEECQPVGFSFRSILKHLWKTTIAVEDTCAKYYEAQLVNPFWKISPLLVISETVSNFVLQPFSAISSHFNIFMKNLYSGVSFVMVIPVTFFAFIVMLMLFRYKLRIPCFVTLEPGIQVSREDRVEFIPIRNADGQEVSHDEVWPKVHAGPQCTVHDDFSAAGDHPVSHTVQKEHVPLEIHELAAGTPLKEQSTQTDEPCKEVKKELCHYSPHEVPL